MATISINTANDRTSNYTPSAGDDFVLSDLASLIVDNSTVSIDIEFNSNFQQITLENVSTTQPNIINIDSGGLNGQNGTLILDGLLISIATADGTASQTIQFPVDVNGNYPSFVGYCYIDSVIHTQITSFTGINNDHRGLHFTYIAATGIMTFGDGTNGQIPTGDVQVENIYVEMGGSSLNLNSGFIRGDGHCVFIEPSFTDNYKISLQGSWGLLNPTNRLQPYQFFKHKYSAMNYIGIGSSVDIKILLAEDTTGDKITFQSESNVSTEMFENYNVPMWGAHEVRVIEQVTNNTASRVRLYNNGGSATIRIMQGYSEIFTPFGGRDGSWIVEWSDGYKTTDLSPAAWLRGRYETKQQILFRLVGNTSWTGERSKMRLFYLQAGEYVIGSDAEQMLAPADMLIDEIINTSNDAKFTLNNLNFLGQASSGTRNLNLNSPAGAIITNVEAPNATVGNQSQPYTTFLFASFIGYDPVFSFGMNHSIITKNAARTEGQIWFMPHAVNANGSIISGSVDDLLYTGERLYITQIGTKVSTRSDVISGCGIITAVTPKGYITTNFDYEYKLWQVGTTEPATYQEMTELNIQADQAGFTTATKWYFKVAVEKVSGNANAGYIEGIYLECPVDPSFKWAPEGSQITVTHPTWDGSAALLLNLTQGSAFIGFQAISGGTGASFDLLEGVDYTIGDTLEFRAGFQSGFTAAEKLRILFVAGESDVPLVEPQVFNPFYPDLQIDGATQDAANGGELSVVNGQVQISISDADGRYDERGVAAWTYYLMLSRVGLQYYFFVGDLVSVAEFSLVSNVSLDNVGSTQILFSNPVRESAQQYFQIIPVDNTFNYVLYPSTSGLGITKQPVKPIYIATPASVFTDADRTTLQGASSQSSVDAIPVNPLLTDDARLDAYSTFNPSTDTVEGSETYDQSIRLIRAEAAGKVAVIGDDVSFRDAQDTKNRIQATTDSSGNRSVVVTDGS